MPQIIDGTGTGKRARVTENNRLETIAITSELSQYANHKNELAFSLTLRVTTTTVDGCVFFIQNDDEIDIEIEQYTISVDAACELYVTINNEGTRNGAVPVVPVNLHGGSGIDAVGVFESGTDLAGGVATLSSGSEIGRAILRGAIPTTQVSASPGIILPKGRAFAGWCDTAGIDLYVRISFNYHNAI